jgi:hypothetical protein
MSPTAHPARPPGLFLPHEHVRGHRDPYRER